MGKKHVKIRRLNWDVIFYKDLLTGIGFQIIEPSGVSIDGVKKKAMYGANSPLYGTTYEDEQSFIERCRCDCGTFVGMQFEGEECPLCHTKVECRSNNINITGWISLGTERIINPYYFNVLQNAIGKSVFNEIVFARYRVTTDGMRTKLKADDYENEPLSKYSYIGVDEFFAHYEEIIKYFKSKKKNKARTFDILLEQKRAVFTTHIPIYSTMLRPQSITSDTFYFGGIDKLINTLYSLSEYVKKCFDIEKDYILQRIQGKVNKMWDLNLDMINGKEGWIRDQLLGGSLNYTSRNVICPDPTLHDNEVDLSYNTFLELYKYKIIYYLMKLNNTNLSRAYDEWKHAFIYSEKVYQVMELILENDNPRLLINRNPTLNYYSMLLMKIRHIKKDTSDYTLSVPLSILPGLNADFDGDILNIIALMDRSLVYMFRKFDPVIRMIISRDSGLLNDYFSITKGQLIDLYCFGTFEGDEGCNTEEEEYDGEPIPIKDLAIDVPYIHNEKEMRMWLKPLYIIEDYMENYDTYTIFKQKIYNVIKGCFTIKNCRNAKIKFKFTKDSTKEYELPFRMFIINTILWYPFVELYGLDVLDESYILSDPELLPNIDDYINDKLINVLNEYHIKTTKKNYAISEVLFNLRRISIDFSIIMGLDFSIPMFIDIYNKDARIREIMECTFEDTDQPSDIEQQMGLYQAEFIERVRSMKDCHLGIALRAKTGIKDKQLAEFAIADSLKPDLTGKTIPIPIQNSTLIKGADTPSYHFISGMSSRKSLVMNKKVMGTAGHFGKIVTMMARTLSMSNEISDCGSKHLVCYNILNKTVLKKLSGKYYKLNADDDNEDLKILNFKSDKHLIGQKVYVRSAATCALKNCVCAKCVGATAITNFDIRDGLGAFESEEITKVVNQNILSAKHLLNTNSEKIEFSSEFYKFFTIIGGEINPNVNDNELIGNIEDYAIYIDPVDIAKVDDQDDDSLYNTMINSGRFYIRNIVDPEIPDIIVQTEGEKEIYISEEASNMLKSGNNLIKFSNLDDDDKLFEVVIMNNELTKPLYELMHLLNRQNKDNITETIDSMSNKFLSLVIEAKIAASVIACELIINRLIRSEYNIFERPDFTKEDIGDYQILTVSKALEKNPAPLIGLSFQNIKRQILSNEMFDDRDETSYIDAYFKTEIPTGNLIKYSKYADKAALTNYQ